MASLPSTPRRYAPNAKAFAHEQAQCVVSQMKSCTSESQVGAAVEALLAWTALEQELETQARIDDRVLQDAARMLRTNVSQLVRRLQLAM